MNILIPMAGLATRFVKEGIDTPKPLIVVNGKTLIEHTLETLKLGGHYIFVTRTYDKLEHNLRLSAMLQKLRPGSREIQLSSPTRGAVETCLAARKWIDNDEELVITNCDQRTEWDNEAFLKHVTLTGADGTVVTHESSEVKHSYALVSGESRVTEIREKEVISHDALIGIHYWRRGTAFVQSADDLLASVVAGERKECYVSETYNDLIRRNHIITAFRVGKNEYIPLGTPYDVAVYEAKVKEYLTEKPRSLFIDLDGTILHHLHRFSEIPSTPPALLDGVLAKLNEWDSHGHRIIFCTARKESARAMTEEHLRGLGLCWDQLIMGLTSGPRVLVNDKLTAASEDRAIAVNLPTNTGFEGTDWKALSL